MALDLCAIRPHGLSIDSHSVTTLTAFSYITHSEWQNDYGGKKHKSERTLYKPLAFDCCAISFQPFEDPVLSPQGYVYDILYAQACLFGGSNSSHRNIIPFIQKHKVDPMTGEPLARKDLVKLHFHKNAEGKYHCPVTFKVRHRVLTHR